MNTKDEILQYGLQLMETRGYSGFSYSDLSQKLGIAKASVHHHFPKKLDLGLEVIKRTEAYLDERLKYVNALDGVDAWQRLNAFFNPGCEKACDGNVCVVSSLLADFLELPEELQRAIKGVCEKERTSVASILEKGREAGELAFRGDAAEQAAFIIEAVKGGLFYSRVWGEEAVASNIEMIRRTLM